MIATSYLPTIVRGVQVLSSLTARERDGIIAALDTGELVPIVDVQPREGSVIVGALTPKHANRFTSSDSDFASEVLAELKEATHELEILREIIRDVLYEEDPIGWESRLMLSIDDVQAAIDGARDRAGEL